MSEYAGQPESSPSTRYGSCIMPFARVHKRSKLFTLVLVKLCLRGHGIALASLANFTRLEINTISHWFRLSATSHCGFQPIRKYVSCECASCRLANREQYSLGCVQTVTTVNHTWHSLFTSLGILYAPFRPKHTLKYFNAILIDYTQLSI